MRAGLDAPDARSSEAVTAARAGAENTAHAPPSVRPRPCASLRIGRKEGHGAAIMGDIVNLNKYRKVRQKADRRQLVAVNRQKFARPKADLVKLEADRRSAAKALDGHALEGNGLDGHALDRHALKGATHADRRAEDAAQDERPGAPRETD